MFLKIKRTLDRRAPRQVISFGFASIGLLAVVDYLTGYELSFSIFYLAPIVTVTWYGTRWISYAACLLCALTWLFVDYASGHTYSHPLIPAWNAGVRLSFFLITAMLLGELRTLLRQEAKLARTDSLTGLLNARAFREMATKTLQAARRHNRPFALAFIDLDNFKSVNDSAGHAEGDRVLQTVADTLGHCVRAADIAGRLGGDEFALLMPEIGRDDAEVTIGRIQGELLSRMRDQGWPVGFSIGVAYFHSSPDSIDFALRAADALMYGVKQAGKNNIRFEDHAGPDPEAAGHPVS